MTSNHSYDHDTTAGQYRSRPSTSGSPVTREQDSRNDDQIFGDGQMGTGGCAKLKPTPHLEEEEDSGEEEAEEEEVDSEEEEAEGEEIEEKNPISALLNRGVGVGFNRVYNLYCLNEELIPGCIMEKYVNIHPPIHADLENIRFCIDPKVFNQLNWKLHFKAELNGSCYIVRFLSPASISPTEKFISLVYGEELRQNAVHENVAAMIIIPISKSRALVYSIGRAYSSIMNKHAIIKQWGLKLAASEDITSTYVKEVKATSQHRDKQKTTITKTSLPGGIGEFLPVAGADRFRQLRLKRKDSEATVEGSTKFEFRLLKTHAQLDKQRDLKTLIEISRELNKIFKKDDIHCDYKKYIADEVNEDLRQKLNEELEIMLRNGSTLHYRKYFCDLDPELFEGQKEKAISDFHDEIRRGFLDALFNTMHKVGAGLESHVDFNHSEGGIKIEKEPVCSLLVVGAFPYAGKSYSYSTSKWYVVPACRFRDVKAAIEHDEIRYEKLGLTCYTEYHVNKLAKTIKGEDMKRKQQELNYNIDAANKLTSRKSAIRGIVCDRLLIKHRTENDFTLEFADIITTNTSETKLGESNCIIHVKRKVADQLAEQCLQLIRTKEYLYSTSDEKKFENIKLTLLRGCFNTLYASRDLKMIKKFTKFSVAKLTHSEVPIKRKKKVGETNDQAVKNIMDSVKEECSKRVEKGISKFMEEMSKAAQTFVRDYKLNIRDVDLFVHSMNALFYCDKERKFLTVDDAANFCDLVQHFYGVAAELFDATLRPKTLYFVLAIINDEKKSMQSDSKGNYANNFTGQELLSLEILKRTVESAGFKFKWTVIENNFSKSQ